MPNLKTCSKCGIEKSRTRFSPDKNNRDGLTYWCKDCCNLRRRTTRKLEPNRIKEQDSVLLRKYHITTVEQEAQLYKQNYKCAICKTTEPGGRYNKWHTDHPHNGRIGIRGLLCSNCNLGLGMFKDDSELLITAALYVRAGGFIENS